MNIQKLIEHIGEFVINNKAADCPHKLTVTASSQTGVNISWPMSDSDILALAHMDSVYTFRRSYALGKKWNTLIDELGIEHFYVEALFKNDTDEDPRIIKTISKGYDSNFNSNIDEIFDDCIADAADVVELRLYRIEELPNGRKIQELIDCISVVDDIIDVVDLATPTPVSETGSDNEGPIRIRNIPKYSITDISDAAKNITDFIRGEKQKILNSKGEVYCMSHSYKETNDQLTFFREVCTAKRLAELNVSENSTSAETVHVRIDDIVYTMWRRSDISGYRLFSTSLTNYNAITDMITADEIISRFKNATVGEYSYVTIGHHEPDEHDGKLNSKSNYQVLLTYESTESKQHMYNAIDEHVFYQTTFIEVYDNNHNLVELYLPGTPQNVAFADNMWTRYNLR